jgi:DNA-binding transcriptional MerR regulator
MLVGDVAKRAGLTARAVRLYEAEGVLPHAARTASGYRTYGEHELELLRFVARLRAIDLPLDDIREVVQLRARGAPPQDRVIALLQAELARLDGAMSALHDRRGKLAAVLHQARAAAGRGEDVRLCRLVAQPEPARTAQYPAPALIVPAS